MGWTGKGRSNVKGNEEEIMKGIQGEIATTKGAFEGPWICNTAQAL